MQIENLDHIGIVVGNLDEAIKFYQNTFGMKLVHYELIPERGIKVAFLVSNEKNETSIELLEPIDHNDMSNTVAKFLKNRGQGLHHLAIKVSDINRALEELTAKGLQLVDTSPRKGARGHLVAFLHPKSVMGVLLELVQAKEL
ncbi:methylmalonyl-CoA epimerase [Saccharolobus solfataricus]|uniref:Lactoylglutathione lyase (Glyoxalase I), putative n=3 Tax=Saccharolobus solfataricus TaxID=2287 RepID=Q97W20_SACS2|nr:methylmalonyl-CoA epimerase [Saccharolobus solfataricus]AAK42570.1 Lactoylglutathione lyase (glyoxalase I), putative [Saccharolobus solfataricus P2]AKA72662.1 methylmalonyl-CoA epimerase [Saccharolobus solfataricus]AKA75362.1 methylmalonyl-CoA epimerase [Saccharolobus solfataricus]AKA78054.1 methylmalonyl-CoA epimerase [Saccharolobus solfataricus]AZF67175.1 methylmalonyl-CoA epimerase [Saccharolobus solfataricus]